MNGKIPNGEPNMTKDEYTKAWNKIIRNSEYPIHYPRYITLFNPEQFKSIAKSKNG